MGGLSLWHWLIVILILMLLFGPSKVEQLGRSLGRAIRGFKEGMNEIDVASQDVVDRAETASKPALKNADESLKSQNLNEKVVTNSSGTSSNSQS